MKARKILLLILIGICSAAVAGGGQRRFDEWAEGFAAEWVRTTPQFATRIQYFSGDQQDAIDRQLSLSGSWGNVLGVKAAKEQAELAKRGLRELRQFSFKSLTPMQRCSWASMEWTLDAAVANAGLVRYGHIFEQVGGLQIDLIDFLTSAHPIRNHRDIENYLTRLKCLGSVLDEGMSEAQATFESGIVPPKVVLQRVIEQLDSSWSLPSAENPLVAALKSRMTNLGDLVSTQDQSKFLGEADSVVRDQVIPAFRRLRTFLAEQLSGASDDIGLSRFPKGLKAYSKFLSRATTTDLTPSAVHAIGLREVGRIEAAMDQQLRHLGFLEGPVQDRIEALNRQRQPPESPDPRPTLLNEIADIVTDAEKRAALTFDVRPKAKVVVKRTPAFMEQGSMARYSDPAPDGSSPGIYWIPLAEIGPRVPWVGVGMKSTAYHEAIPGHHFQIAVQQESTELPRFRRFGVFGMNDAYVEGWALYAEALADEDGWYDHDPAGRLGFLYLQLVRARRLVADTGIHAMKWTRQQVIDYGFTPEETERYIVWPGQACSYMIGCLRIREIRENARSILGADFSIKAFHNFVLQTGAVPLSVLSTAAEDWIVEQKRRGAGARH